jgi:hypothetical protein
MPARHHAVLYLDHSGNTIGDPQTDEGQERRREKRERIHFHPVAKVVFGARALILGKVIN